MLASPGGAQIRVNPTGVNVNAQGATSVFLTYGGIVGHQAVEAYWCGAIIPAAPAIGMQCDPATIFGRLPLRFDRSRGSGIDAMTDIMTIPSSVARRAYQAAEAGQPSAFYYVRRFQSLAGGPDQYVAVTCRLTGGGARTPLSLTDVRLAFTPDVPLLHVAAGEPMPALRAEIAYTGTGRLAGRWEVVLPGDELPTPDDLLTEASLPFELRATQRRYTQLSRFNVFVPPGGRLVLDGPETERLPTTADGVYHVLLRIEVTSEKEGDSDLAAVGAGDRVVPGGAVAGFPMPMLRYLVGSGQGGESAGPVRGVLRLHAPGPGAVIDTGVLEMFTWQAATDAAVYTIEFETREGEPILSALVIGAVTAYRVPPWFHERVAGRPFRWRVIARDAAGRGVASSGWRAAAFDERPR